VRHSRGHDGRIVGDGPATLPIVIALSAEALADWEYGEVKR